VVNSPRGTAEGIDAVLAFVRRDDGDELTHHFTFEGVVGAGGRLPVGAGLAPLVFFAEQHFPLLVREVKDLDDLFRRGKVHAGMGTVLLPGGAPPHVDLVALTVTCPRTPRRRCCHGSLV
jgi:hypothetical protein